MLRQYTNLSVARTCYTRTFAMSTTIRSCRCRSCVAESLTNESGNTSGLSNNILQITCTCICFIICCFVHCINCVVCRVSFYPSNICAVNCNNISECYSSGVCRFIRMLTQNIGSCLAITSGNVTILVVASLVIAIIIVCMLNGNALVGVNQHPNTIFYCCRWCFGISNFFCANFSIVSHDICWQC